MTETASPTSAPATRAIEAIADALTSIPLTWTAQMRITTARLALMAATADLEPIARAIHATRDPEHRRGLNLCAAGPKSPHSCWAMAEAARMALLGGDTLTVTDPDTTENAHA